MSPARGAGVSGVGRVRLTAYSRVEFPGHVTAQRRRAGRGEDRLLYSDGGNCKGTAAAVVMLLSQPLPHPSRSRARRRWVVVQRRRGAEQRAGDLTGSYSYVGSPGCGRVAIRERI